MPVFWILVVGVLLYMALQILEKHHSSGGEKQTAGKPDIAASEPVEAPVAAEPAAGKSTPKRPFLDTIAGMPGETKKGLMKFNLTTPKAIADTPDKDLLMIKGIGPARLKQIRAACADAKDPESEFAG
jgi:hypothetical protein